MRARNRHHFREKTRSEQQAAAGSQAAADIGERRHSFSNNRQTLLSGTRRANKECKSPVQSLCGVLATVEAAAGNQKVCFKYSRKSLSCRE
jgi:hypothetical protein